MYEELGILCYLLLEDALVCTLINSVVFGLIYGIVKLILWVMKKRKGKEEDTVR